MFACYCQTISEGNSGDFCDSREDSFVLSFLFSARCQQVIEKSFESWNNNGSNRRFRQMKLVLDVPSDYEPVKMTRPNCSKRKQLSKSSEPIKKKPKNSELRSVRCEFFIHIWLSKLIFLPLF